MLETMASPGDASRDGGVVCAAIAGDRAAFGELYVRYARMVHGILLAKVPPKDAEDLVQDVFMAAMRQLRGLRTAAAFRGWLSTIARNRAMDYFRRARETTPLESVQPAAPPAPAQDAFLLLDQIRTLPHPPSETPILRLVPDTAAPQIVA